MLYQTKFRSPLGELISLASEQGVCYLSFETSESQHFEDFRRRYYGNQSISSKISSALQATGQYLENYFAGKFQSLSLPPIDLQGTYFSTQVWQSLSQITLGSTKSYRELAALHQKPKAARLIGNIMKNNPIGILLPCHRVIGTNGQLTGYRGQLWRKEYLLDHEKKHTIHQNT